MVLFLPSFAYLNKRRSVKPLWEFEGRATADASEDSDWGMIQIHLLTSRRAATRLAGLKG
jgi:hypothetical protein